MSIYSEIRPEVLQLSELSLKSSAIDPELYQKYDVKRGLRDLNGKRRSDRTDEHFRNCFQQNGGRKECPLRGGALLPGL